MAKSKTKLTNGMFSCDVIIESAADEDKLKLDSICSCHGKPKLLGLKCECGKVYANVKDPPMYGFPVRPSKHEGKFDYDVVLTKEKAKELFEVENSTIEVVKFITLDDLARNFAIVNTEYLIPDESVKNPASIKLYHAYVKVLSKNGWCLLAKFANRGKVRRYALIGDKYRNVLMAQEIVNLKDMPVSITPVDLSASELEFVNKQFDSLISKDASLPEPEDKLFKFIKNEKMTKKKSDKVKSDIEEKVKNVKGKSKEDNKLVNTLESK